MSTVAASSSFATLRTSPPSAVSTPTIADLMAHIQRLELQNAQQAAAIVQLTDSVHRIAPPQHGIQLAHSIASAAAIVGAAEPSALSTPIGTPLPKRDALNPPPPPLTLALESPGFTGVATAETPVPPRSIARNSARKRRALLKRYAEENDDPQAMNDLNVDGELNKTPRSKLRSKSRSSRYKSSLKSPNSSSLFSPRHTTPRSSSNKYASSPSPSKSKRKTPRKLKSPSPSPSPSRKKRDTSPSHSARKKSSKESSSHSSKQGSQSARGERSPSPRKSKKSSGSTPRKSPQSARPSTASAATSISGSNATSSNITTSSKKKSSSTKAADGFHSPSSSKKKSRPSTASEEAVTIPSASSPSHNSRGFASMASILRPRSSMVPSKRGSIKKMASGAVAPTFRSVKSQQGVKRDGWMDEKEPDAHHVEDEKQSPRIAPAFVNSVSFRLTHPLTLNASASSPALAATAAASAKSPKSPRSPFMLAATSPKSTASVPISAPLDLALSESEDDASHVNRSRALYDARMEQIGNESAAAPAVPLVERNESVPSHLLSHHPHATGVSKNSEEYKSQAPPHYPVNEDGSLSIRGKSKKHKKREKSEREKDKSSKDDGSSSHRSMLRTTSMSDLPLQQRIDHAWWSAPLGTLTLSKKPCMVSGCQDRKLKGKQYRFCHRHEHFYSNPNARQQKILEAMHHKQAKKRGSM